MQPVTLAKAIDDVLGPSGRLGRVLKNPEVRPGQLQAAKAIADALESGKLIAIEAGTGTGKSLAGLIPAALWAAKHKKRIVFAPHTITLQEQLVKKDVPLLQQLFPELELRTALIKGRRNYICKRKLAEADKPWFKATFSSPAAAAIFRNMIAKIQASGAIDKDSLPFNVSAEVWEPIQSDSDTCLGPSCKFFTTCNYFTTQKEAQKAQVIIANQALVFTDLFLKAKGEDGVLPKYEVLILDEAHHLEESVTNAWGTVINIRSFERTKRAISDLALRLGSKKRGKDLFLDYAERIVVSGSAFLESLGESRLLLEPCGDAREVLELLLEIDHAINDVLTGKTRRKKSAQLSLFEEQKEEDGAELREDIKLAANAAKRRLAELSRDLTAWTGQIDKDFAYWIDKDRMGRPAAHMAPIEVGNLLKRHLFKKGGPTVIAMSATLSDALLHRCGFPNPTVIRVKSPFDLRKQALFYCPLHAMIPTQENVPAYEDYVARHVLQLVEASRGRSLVLFTSKQMMRRVYDLTAPSINEMGYNVYYQDGEVPRGELVKKFRQDVSSCLFGLLSMWEGVDVPGEACSSVIIARLPFGVPTDPLSVARAERLRARGKEPFLALALPDALIKFRQGVGRLIRTAYDRGVVAVLDGRFLATSWGREFRNAIPEVPGTRSLKKVRALFDEKEEGEEAAS